VTDTKTPAVGTVVWRDLTVKNADTVRDFYARVVGWSTAPLDMGGYSDYLLTPPGSDEPIAGVCHTRGRTRTSRLSG
jgi:predicted enzyme related to lactoylglutathione lyase